MRFQIKKILEGYDPAELIEQSMYCFGSDSSDNDNSGGDEAMEVAGRPEVAQDFSSSPNQGGYASDDARDNYVAQQTAVANAVAQGEQLGAGLNNYQPYTPSPLEVQDFAREQDFFDANPMSTAVDAPFTSRMADINVGAGDIFGLKNQIANKLSQGGTAVTNDLGDIVGATGQTPLFGIPFLPNVTTYTGRNEYNPFGDPTMGSDNNESQITVPTSTNPITGKEQCPDGYVFDSDLQACRLKTKSDDAVGTPKNPPDMNAPAFTRNYSLLNTAPSNLPKGFDYNQANQNFMSRFATRPSIYKKPPTLLGYTPFGSS